MTDKPIVDPAPVATPWQETLPDDLKVHNSLEKFKDKGVDEVFRSYVNLESAYGKKMEGMIKVPGAEAPPEEVAAFHKALGVPENVADFTIDVPQDLQTYIPAETAKAFAPIFHQLGVPPKVASTIIQAYGEYAQRVIGEKQKEYAEGREKLKKEWGDATFNRRTALAERAIEHLMSDEQIELFNQNGLQGHPLIVQLFAKLGEDMAEDGLIEGTIVGAPTASTLEARKKEIEAEPYFWSDKVSGVLNLPKHTAFKEEWNKIQRALNPVSV